MKTILTSHFSGSFTALMRGTCTNQTGIIDREKEESENTVWKCIFWVAAAPADGRVMKMRSSGSFDPLPEGN